jgi:hypothetical protein
MNYEDDIRIDETALDVEWLEQASLAMKYGRHYAFCRKKLTEAEEKVKVIRAELIAEANADPEGCCNKKNPNAADIEAYYRMHNKHKKAKEEWVRTQYELDMAEIAKNEISFTRKVALENLVKLHGQQYFAGPKIPRDITWERQEKQKRSNIGVAEKISRKSREV